MTKQQHEEHKIEVLRNDTITDEEKNMGILLHVLGLFVGIFSPLIFYFVKQDSEYVKSQAYVAFNYHVSYLIYTFASIIAMFVLIGALLMPLVLIMYLVSIIICIINATKLEVKEAPLAIKIFK